MIQIITNTADIFSTLQHTGQISLICKYLRIHNEQSMNINN